MAFALSIKQRLLASHLFAAVVLAGAFGTFLYYMAAQQVVERLRVQLNDHAAAIAGSLDVATLDAAAHDAAARRALVARLQGAAISNPHIARLVVYHGAANEELTSSDGDAPPTEGELSTRAPVPGDGSYALGAVMRSGVISENLYNLRIGAVLAFLLCALAALVLSRVLANRILARITDLAFRCRMLAAGQPLPPRPAGAHDELEDLAQEFDHMATRLRDAAHERESAATAVRQANAQLEANVRKRTSELERATAQLRGELEQRTHVQALLAEAAMTDVLTGLLNRRAMMEMLGQAAAQRKPGDASLCVIVADIDYFKRINDQHGHDVGDRVLVSVATRLRELAGDSLQHHVARWGGEEFLMLLPGTRLQDAARQADHIRRSIEALNADGRGLHVTLSAGVAELSASDTLADCLRRCDQALYRAKDAGRNQVIAAQGEKFATVA
jgi:diguanylate cyclase (GGDEF)-like protein